MAKNFSFLFLFFPLLAYSLEGVVTVLEAPLFRIPSTRSKIVQHLRKGETIYLHPSIEKKEEFEEYSPSEEDEVAFLDDENSTYQKSLQDPFIDKNLYEYDHQSEFLKTVDNTGSDAYILKEHVFIYYGDEREVSQITKGRDKTDYRIQEPLPANYPFINKEKRYRGLFAFGLGTENRTLYSYPESKLNQSFSFRKEATFLWTRKAKFDRQERFYLGTLVSFNASENDFELESRLAKEQWFKLGIGPAVTYDFWRQKKNAVTGFFSLLFNVINSNKIRQYDPSTLEEETRTFKGLSFTPKAAAYYRRVRSIGVLDFVAGLNVALEMPYRIKTSDRSSHPGWWLSENPESFQVSPSLEGSLFLGFQASI